jgi:glutaconate CoA-transferase subunit B
MIYYAARRAIVFRTEHSRRTFVERVDFISAAGSSPPDVLRLGGPVKVITPLATLRMNPERGRLELESVHPPHSAAEVAERTGFDLGPLGSVVPTPAPAERELDLLRGAVRQRMIDTGTYASWAESRLGAA